MVLVGLEHANFKHVTILEYDIASRTNGAFIFNFQRQHICVCKFLAFTNFHRRKRAFTLKSLNRQLNMHI